jgi:hypothetical protein
MGEAYVVIVCLGYPAVSGCTEASDNKWYNKTREVIAYLGYPAVSGGTEASDNNWYNRNA